MLRQAGPGHRLGPRDSQRMSRVEEEASGVSDGHTLSTHSRSNGVRNTDLGADPSNTVWEERNTSASFTIPPEPPRPLAFVCEEVSLHEVISAEG